MEPQKFFWLAFPADLCVLSLHIQYGDLSAHTFNHIWSGVRVVMELRLGLSKHSPQWLCLVGSNPTRFNDSFAPGEHTAEEIVSIGSFLVEIWYDDVKV